MNDRSDAAIVGRLIERARLLIALSEEIPIETKLNTQALLKMFEAAVGADDARAQAASYYQQLYDDLEPFADIEALLSAMRVFLPYV